MEGRAPAGLGRAPRGRGAESAGGARGGDGKGGGGGEGGREERERGEMDIIGEEEGDGVLYILPRCGDTSDPTVYRFSRETACRS
mgnify:CR=1 FL=1